MEQFNNIMGNAINTLNDRQKLSSKIKINCGYCKKSKRCEIKKAFKDVAKHIKGEHYHHNFDLFCPFVTPKYSNGDIIDFTVGFGAYKQKVEWECDWDCDFCRHGDRCKDGIVTFRNKRYKGYAKMQGKVTGYAGHGKYLIDVDLLDFEKSKHLFNRYDLLKIHSISNHLSGPILPFCYDRKTITFYSKEKFIIGLKEKEGE